MFTTPARPLDLDLSSVDGIGVIVHIDPRMQLTQEMLVAIQQGATMYMKCLFTPQETVAFKKNSMFWNVPYTRSQMGFLPEPFQVYKNMLYIHYHPSAVPRYKDIVRVAP